MAKYLKITLSILMMSVIIISCKKDSPVDEDGLLITFRQECFVSNFELLGADFVTVNPGNDLKNVYPQFTLATDCKLDPKVIGKTDLSNLASPKIYTVVSGNRKIRKPYTLNIKF